MRQRLIRCTFALAVIAAILGSGGIAGCRASSRSPYLSREATPRDTAKAQRLHAEASRLQARGEEVDEAEVENLLRRALAADIYHGPSHNNLGILYLAQSRLYDAANEFEWARKLMPGHPAPRVNLAMTLERAGRTQEALDAYDAALAVYDGYLPAIQGKARLQIASGRTNEDTVALLDAIAMRGDTQWREWARLWRLKLREP